MVLRNGYLAVPNDREECRNPIVRVEKHKRPSGVGSWCAYHLGVDDHGVWLFTPAHSMFRSDTTEGVDSCEVAQDRLNGVGRNSVTLMPRGQWWVATWVQDAVNLCSADISTAPSFNHGVWRFEDLELDPFLRVDGYGVEDADEFDEACAAGLISLVERSAAIEAEAQLRAAFVIGSGLVLAGADWLRYGIGLQLEPLGESIP